MEENTYLESYRNIVAEVLQETYLELRSGSIFDNIALAIAARIELRWLDYIKQYTYDPTFGDDKLCTCGHTYYRHFDTLMDSRDLGCKYCMCRMFTSVGK